CARRFSAMIRSLPWLANAVVLHSVRPEYAPRLSRSPASSIVTLQTPRLTAWTTAGHGGTIPVRPAAERNELHRAIVYPSQCAGSYLHLASVGTAHRLPALTP